MSENDNSTDLPSRQIPLSQGLYAVVDESEYDWLSQWKWSADIRKGGQEYAARTIGNYRKNEKQVYVMMHRLIMGAPPNRLVDHRNGNGLDNRKQNLRLCNSSENTANSKKRDGTTSIYKGVTRDKRTGKWAGQIKVNYKRIWLGYYASEIEAAKAYNDAALVHFGSYSRLNDI